MVVADKKLDSLKKKLSKQELVCFISVICQNYFFVWLVFFVVVQETKNHESKIENLEAELKEENEKNEILSTEIEERNRGFKTKCKSKSLFCSIYIFLLSQSLNDKISKYLQLVSNIDDSISQIETKIPDLDGRFFSIVLNLQKRL